MQKINSPGLAAGGAWASASQASKTRQVNFNFEFGNLNALLAELTPIRRRALQQFSVSTVRLRAGRQGLLWTQPVALLQAEFFGSARSISWNDSVLDAKVLHAASFDDDWYVELDLRGLQSSVVLMNWTPFMARIMCKLPVSH
jgi:hypothetical protein